ncbi:MAG: DUF3553 domain-containing protein, partial [Actinomycetes bacterium]
DEIVERLSMRDPLVVVRGFDRPNLRLEVVRHIEDDDKRRAVVDQVAELTAAPSPPAPGLSAAPSPPAPGLSAAPSPPAPQLTAPQGGGQGLLYVATRKDTEAYAAQLVERGLRAAAYHAGLRSAERKRVHEAFTGDQLDVVVATSAFGMGIDKPNVRFVVHAAVTDSPDSYYQEIGRAGRDGEPALAVLHYRPEDLGLRRFFTAKHPDAAGLKTVLSTLRAASGPLRMKDLRALSDLSPRKVTNLVNLLEQAGLVSSGKRGLSAPGTVEEAEGVERAVAVAEARERVDRSRLEMMRGYAETTGCRRQFLLGYFGEELEESCGNCDTCAAGTAQEAQQEAEVAEQAAGDSGYGMQAHVRHPEWGDGVVMRREADRITVLFEQEGYKTLSLELVDENDLLEVVDAPASGHG